AGCVPTSLSMILRGSYGYNVNPVSVATRMASYGGVKKKNFCASATYFVVKTQSYGRSVKSIYDVAKIKAHLF
ncbi:C39 family peptidase, partial [Enterococcus faecalis]|uniref:C39 family peptidase n=1 Tax=Enterococcus faecalis TaxID=1351 RepID=UPI003178C2CE